MNIRYDLIASIILAVFLLAFVGCSDAPGDLTNNDKDDTDQESQGESSGDDEENDEGDSGGESDDDSEGDSEEEEDDDKEGDDEASESGDDNVAEGNDEETEDTADEDNNEQNNDDPPTSQEEDNDTESTDNDSENEQPSDTGDSEEPDTAQDETPEDDTSTDDTSADDTSADDTGQDSTGDDSDDGQSSDNAEDPAPSSGCGASPPSNGSHSVEVTGQGERTYLLDLPNGYDSNTPYPIVFGHHGMSTDGELFRSNFYGNLLSSTMADEAIVIHPNAVGDPTAWDTNTDVEFFDAMLAQLKTMVCIDENRIFATGHSSGGFFSNSLGCSRGDVLRGIAPVSGGGPMTFGGSSCTGQVAAWIAHAPNDDTVDFSSGESSRDHWVEANGCTASDAQPVTPDGCVTYGGCDDGYPVTWCEYDDGHNWPSYAPQAMWDFFKSL